jgi:predicted nucleotidyltransferase
MDAHHTQLIRSVLEDIPHDRCVLFGSRARGDAASDSDYDLLVIVPGKVGHTERLVLASTVRKRLAAHLIDADVIVRAAVDVEWLREMPGSVVRNALAEGVDV